MELVHENILFLAGVNLDFDFTFIIQLVVVLILMVVLKTFVFDTYLNTIDERDKKTGQTRDAANQLREQADTAAKKYEEALATARSEANEVRQRLRLEGVVHKDKAIGDARQTAQAHIEETLAGVESDLETARQQVESQVDEIAGLVVTKIIGRGV